MKVSDYIISAIEKEGVKDVFGIPGVGCGHFTDSLRESRIRNHIMYHEQGAAFAACAYGQASGNMGVAYATAGPGATNLLTGIANAYVDSVPALYIVGDKDSDTLKGGRKLRQMASQEVDIVEMARPVTKWSYQIKDAGEVRYVFEKAFYLIRNGRPGPVLLDIPSDIQRAECCAQEGFVPDEEETFSAQSLVKAINYSSHPLILAGGGVRQAGMLEAVRRLSAACGIPIAATVVCDDALYGFENYIGFIGVDGDACANDAAAACDLLLCLGARLNIKEVGKKRSAFAPQARIIRVDIDRGELDYRVGNEEAVHADLKAVIPSLLDQMSEIRKKTLWVVRDIKRNDRAASTNKMAFESMCALAGRIPEDVDISVGIGSHRRWFISGRIIKPGWRIFQSAGLASMGFAFPASIGIHYASGRPVVCIDGDGGIMMNIQELQVVCREKLPVTLVVFNNRCLGEIMEFQKEVFNGNYMGTTEETGYLAADFEALAAAFRFAYKKVESAADMEALELDFSGPNLIEVVVPTNIGR